MTRVLTYAEAKAFYDRLGARQDTQWFYEDPATADLIEHGDFGAAHAVFEFGCGTGRLADRLLSDHLPAACRYRGADISTTMVGLARQRLGRWGDRARVEQTSGGMRLDISDASFDRFLVTYVFDLLSEADIGALLAEAHRVLVPGGLLCTAALTEGATPAAHILGFLWKGLFRLSPKIVGGCRPIVLARYLRSEAWELRHRRVVTRFGISSEVLIAARRGA